VVVDPALRSVMEAMSVDARLELAELIESTVDQSEIEISDEEKATIRSRGEHLGADPSVALSWDELDAQVGSRWA
jgi:putative addiction module component (TIGR02574 family)